MEGYKIVAAIGFAVLIGVLGAYMFANGDTLFKNVGYMKYSDDCVENYTNGELMSDECILGRAIEKQREDQAIARRTGINPSSGLNDYKWNNQTNKLEILE